MSPKLAKALQTTTRADLKSVAIGAFYLAIICAVTSMEAQAESTAKDIPSNSWEQIVFPALSYQESFRNLLEDDLDISEYGEKWILYSYESNKNAYEDVDLESGPNIGEGYWIIQITGQPVSIDIPNSLSELTPVPSIPCGLGNFCTTHRPYNEGGVAHWNLIGAPFDEEHALGSIRIDGLDSTSPCFLGCSLPEAVESNLISPNFYSYDSSIQEYITLNQESTVGPWQAVWSRTLSSDAEIEIIFIDNFGSHSLEDDADGLVYATVAYDYIQFGRFVQPEPSLLRLPFGLPDLVSSVQCADPHYSVNSDGTLNFEEIRMVRQRARIVGFSQELTFSVSPRKVRIEYSYFSAVTRELEVGCDKDFPVYRQYAVPVSAFEIASSSLTVR